MIKEWHTAQSLAKLKLKGLPKTERAFQIKAKNGAWKKRNRAVGKGYEYHISNLPDDARIELVEKSVGTTNLSKINVYADAFVDAPEKVKITNDDRRNARIIILTLFDQYLDASKIGVCKAYDSFIQLYKSEGNQSDSDLVPDWVYGTYPDFTFRTLCEWRKLRMNNNAFSALGTKYGNRKGTSILSRAEDGEVATYITTLITTKSHLTCGHIRDLVRNKFGRELSILDAKTNKQKEIPLPKIRAFERFVSSWKSENKDMLLKLTDPDAYKNKHLVAYGKADAGITEVNQRWEIDASPVDAFCTDGRYNLYALIDVYSRRTIFMVSKTPCTEASLLIIRKAIKAWGVPECIKTDNGADFISKRFQTALISMQIRQEMCTPFSPEQKPFVERVIGTLQRDLMPTLPGFVGHNVADRKKIEAVKAFSQRLGEKDKEAFAIQMTSEQLQGHLDNWAQSKYEHTIHTGIKMTPFERANSCTAPVKTINNDRALDLLLAPIASGEGWRTVTKKGLRVDSGQFIAPELALYIGKQVFVRHDPSDMGLIYVYDDQQKFVCEALDPERRGIDRNEVSAMAKAKQSADMKEKTAEIKRIARGIKPEHMINDYLHHHIEESKNVTSFPKKSEAHTSIGLEEAAKAISKPETPTENTITERQEAIRDSILKANEERKPVQSIFHDEKKAQFIRAVNLEKREAAGQRMNEKDFRWLQGYRETPAYRSQKRALEHFGSSYIEEEL